MLLIHAFGLVREKLRRKHDLSIGVASLIIAVIVAAAFTAKAPKIDLAPSSIVITER